MSKCKNCSFQNPSEKFFCEKCKINLNANAPYWLTFEDFAHPQDIDNLSLIREVEPIPSLINSAVNSFQEAFGKGRLLKDALTVSEKNFPRIYDLIVECGDKLCVRFLPKIFIIRSHTLNAFTIGGKEKPIIVLHSALVRKFSAEKLTVVLGHEMGHVKGDHQTLHTVAYLLANGINFFSRLPLISLPLELGLKSWHRYSELTADRASLLVINDLDVVKTVQWMISGENVFNINRAGFEKLEELAELWRTHPFTKKRVRELEAFNNSKSYKRLLSKMALAEVMKCPHCHNKVSAQTIFCSKCQKSLV